MLTVLIPMAGKGSRFAKAGYRQPKPFVDLAGLPMIERVRRNLPSPDVLVVVALEEHQPQVKEWARYVYQTAHPAPQDIRLVYVPEVTGGAACTVLMAKEEIFPESELLIANCDQWIDWSPEHFIGFCRRSGADGVIPSFRSSDKRWSFLDLRADGTVRQVLEKVPISDMATCGIYWWRKAKNCMSPIEGMIADGTDRVNGEWYLAPSYNWLIREDEAQIIPYPVPRMVGLGTPDDLEKALNSGIFGDGTQAH